MRIHRKRYTPEELGSILYETLRSGLASDGDLSVMKLVESLDVPKTTASEQYVGDVMIGSMFSAVLAVERSTSRWIAKQVCRGMREEFLRHLKEQGASFEQVSEWDAIVDAHFDEYRKCLEGYEGFEPPWKLGRLFLWNITGEEKYHAISIKIATLYLLEARYVCQSLINEHGPTLVMNPAT